MTSKVTVLLLPLLFVGCVMGPKLRDYEPARSPAGLAVNVLLAESGERISGELLAVNDSALLVLRGGERIVEVPFRTAEWIRSSGPVEIRVTRGRIPDQRGMEYMSRHSRYPQGVSPALLSELLRAYGQTAVIRPGQS